MNEEPALRPIDVPLKTNEERDYVTAFGKYLRMKGSPRKEDVPAIPKSMTDDRARDLRWAVYEQVRKIGQNLC